MHTETTVIIHVSQFVRWLFLFLLLLVPFSVGADGIQDNVPEQVRRVPGLGIEVPAAKRTELTDALARLRQLMEQIETSGGDVARDWLPDVDVLYRAAHDALAYQEFFREEEIDHAMTLIRMGEARANELLTFAPKGGDSHVLSWTQRPDAGLVVRGYRSRIDQTAQPYGLVLPSNYSHKGAAGFRLDVWFHGRGENMSENVFITQRLRDKGQFAPDNTIVLHPYGRYSNAFKFAGEVDVLEAIEHVRKHYNIDDNRISVRGFSMGGAACWQFAVHYADRWFAANPGAGFAETPEFLKSFQKETLRPTWYEQKLWQMYDCNLWAKNLLHCPTVAYSGEEDIQKQAADIMESALDELGVKLVHVIGPKTGHSYHPDAARDVAIRLDSLAESGRERMPRAIDFVTYTLKYNRMHWLTVDAMQEHWEAANVSAKIGDSPSIDIATKNVSQLTVNIPAGYWPHPVTSVVEVTINADKYRVRATSDRALQFTVHLRDWEWELGPAPTKAGLLRKRHDLQGPIDDAFMDSFLFVRPTGKAWHEAMGRWSADELDRAIEHWRRHFRGSARVKLDTEVTDEDIASSHLILWGDPQSNQWMGQVSDQLPISWNARELRVGEKSYDASHHALIAIYPNPKNPQRYVVFNSSFTFREFAYLNNARQVAKLPDWAVVDLRTPPDALWPGKVVDANFFDEAWQLK